MMEFFYVHRERRTMRTKHLLPLVFFIPLFLAACSLEKHPDKYETGVQDASSAPVLSPSSPQVIEQPLPYYPAKAFALKQSGVITVHYSITATGVVDNAKITESTPAGLFDREVLNTIKKWRFKPGNPIENVESRIIFSMKNGAEFSGAPVIIKPNSTNLN
ncbi:TonB family protein [Enterobacter sp. 63]